MTLLDLTLDFKHVRPKEDYSLRVTPDPHENYKPRNKHNSKDTNINFTTDMPGNGKQFHWIEELE